MALKDGLVGYWKLDGNVLDSLGINNGTVISTATSTASGKIRGAYDFNGSTDEINTGTRGFPTGASPRTVSCWIYSRGSAVVDQFFFSYGSSASASNLFAIFRQYTTSKLSFAGWSNDYTSDYVIANNTWFHIVCTYNGSLVKLYVNKVLVGTSGAITLATLSTGICYIGGGTFSTQNKHYNGVVDEVAVYNRVLLDAEISMLYNDGNGLSFPFGYVTTDRYSRETDKGNVFTMSQGAFGYWAGGYTGAKVATVDRVVFSTGITAANTVSNLAIQKWNLKGLSDANLYGYFAGGTTGADVATTDRITFSSGVTAANTVSNLSVANEAASGLSDITLYGYFGGGYTGNRTAGTDRITFTTGATAANTTSNLSQARSGASSLSNYTTYGYWSGGYAAAGPTNTGDRITFSTGATAANTASNLSTNRDSGTGVSDSTTYGYFIGGGAPSAVTDRLTFSTSTAAANTSSNLSAGRDAVGVNDIGNYGWLAGGSTGGYVATADRIVFATSVTSANTVSNLSQARIGHTGLGSIR